MKKGGDGTFNVNMVSFDGAEVSELVGLYIMGILAQKLKNFRIGLYWDNGLAAFYNINSQKDIMSIFKDLRLNITMQANLKEVNLLDITFNLTTGMYRPYKKPNDSPTYISTC